MARSSLQVCMDTSEWLQGTMSSEEVSTGRDSSLSSPLGGGTCSLSRAGSPLMERTLRPPHDLNLKCPRCDSSHTKFCYYNNYSLSQPRYFCKACRRYWTKGGTLRSIPVGGGCRKNKKSSSKKANSNDHQHHQSIISQGLLGSSNNNNSNPNDNLHLSFPQVQFSPHLVNLIGAQMSNLGGGNNFMENGNWLRPIDFMESKYEGLVGGNNREQGYDFMGGHENGSNEFGIIGGMIGNHQNNVIGNNNGGYNNNGLITSNFGGIINNNNNIISSSSTSSFGISSTHDHINHDGNSRISFMDQRLLLPYDGNANNNNHQNGLLDVKPNPKHLSLEWHDQGYNVNDTISSWNGMMSNGFQSSTTNSLV